MAQPEPESEQDSALKASWNAGYLARCQEEAQRLASPADSPEHLPCKHCTFEGTEEEWNARFE